MDETGHTFRARVRTTWAPVGRPPVLKRVSQRREISSIIAVTPDGRLAAWHVRGAAHGCDVVRALKHFQHVLDRRLLIVWDRGTAHRAACVRAYVAASGRELHVQWLPAYAPELNPEEQANGVLKARMANALPDSVNALKGLACRGIRYLQRHPTLVRHFFVHAGLHVNSPA